MQMGKDQIEFFREYGERELEKVTSEDIISIEEIHKLEKREKEEKHYEMVALRDKTVVSFKLLIHNNVRAFYEDGDGIIKVPTIYTNRISYDFEYYKNLLIEYGYELEEVENILRNGDIGVQSFNIVRFVPEEYEYKQKNVERNNWITNAINFFGRF